MTKVSIAAAPADGIEVDLWGSDYTLLAATRSRGRKARPFEQKLEELEEAAQQDEPPEDLDDQMVDTIGRLLDVILAPVTGTTRASTLIGRKWKGDELTLAQLLGFVNDLGEANSPPR